MEKYCPKCRQKRNSRSKFCDMCGTPLEEREGRIKLPKGMYDKVYRRDGYRCQMCGASKNNGAELTIDHIIPLAAGGSNSINNLQTLCRSCNENKADLIFKSGLDVDIEIKKNELKSLLKVISEKREKFKSLTNLLSEEKEILSNYNEDEKIDIIFNIKQLEEEFIPTIESDLKKLNKELQLIEEDLRLKILEKQEKNRLFKILYINIDDSTLSFLKKHFSIDKDSKSDILKSLIEEHEEKEIYDIIFNEFYNDLNKKYRYLVIFRFENSKKNFVNYLINNNFSKDALINELTSTRNHLRNNLLYDLDLNYKQKILLKKYFSLENCSDNVLADRIIDSQYSKKELLNILDSYRLQLLKELSSKISKNDLQLIKEYYSIYSYSKKQTVEYLFDEKNIISSSDISNLLDHISEYNKFSKS